MNISSLKIKISIQVIILFLVIALLGGLYIRFTWERIEKYQSENVLQIARNIEAFLPQKDLRALEGKEEEILSPHYQVIKNALKEAVRVNSKARFAYIYTERDGKVYFIADSEPENSKDYSPPGQEYTEAKSEDKQPFRDGKELITSALPDRWGIWRSVYIPIKEETTGKTIAIFGLDYDAKSWNHSLLIDVGESSVLTVLLLFVLLLFFIIKTRNTSLKNEIAERKRVKKTILMLAHAVRSIGDCVSITDMKDNLLFVNNALLKTYQYEEHELLGKSIEILRSPNNPPAVTEEILLSTLQGGWRGELLNRKKDGNEFPVFITTSVIYDENSQPVALIGVATDITERKQAESTLQESEARFRLMADTAPVLIWKADTGSLRDYFNQSWLDFTGHKLEQEIGNGWAEGVHPDDFRKCIETYIDAFKAHQKFSVEFRLRRFDGEYRWFLDNGVPRVTTDGKFEGYIGTCIDITEQKNTQRVLLKARQEAESANKAKSVFLANMSHEIRTPLNAIIGFSQLMNRDQHLTDLQKEYILSIIRAGEHLLSLINDILELSKMEAGRMELNPRNIDLYSLLADIHMIFKEPAQTKHLQFIFETAADLPKYALIDDNKLRRIYINLIGNAIKFTNEGGVAVRTRIDKMNEQKSRLIVDIQDSGPGISVEESDKLFKHFVQTSSGINNSSGTGLGLALSRELAILMGGDITVVSEAGKGSIFTFQVEIEAGTAEDIHDLIKRRVIGIDKVQNNYRILVVDDKEENLQVVVNLLRIAGFETMEAVNGLDAIMKFEKWNPHLILMDMRMPVMDGYEATRRIKLTEKGKQVPIIALTASSLEDEQRKTVALSMQGYIRKPFRESELFGTIGNVLGIKYFYEEEAPFDLEKYHTDDVAITEDIGKLPIELVSKMQDAVAVADLDLLIELINSIDTENYNLVRHLMALANNFDYEYLQRILSKKDI